MGAVLASFYDDVLRELITATGAALFLGNLVALVRRRSDADQVGARLVARARPGSPVRGQARPAEARDLAQAPLTRTVVWLVVGLVVTLVGLASLTR